MTKENGKFKLKVKITKKDIAQGRRNSCNRCPGAIAIRRALKEAKVLSGKYRIDVGYDNVELSKGRLWGLVVDTREATNPKKLASFVETFDGERKGKVKPLEVTLRFNRVE